MTENNVRDREPTSAGAWLMRSLPSPSRNTGLSEITTAEAASKAYYPNLDANPKPERRDWSASLDLIHEATAAIRISEERTNELELELERTVIQARERAAALEAQIAIAQNRAEQAEQRATEAEEWLSRMHDAVVNGLARNSAQKAASASGNSSA